jgi:hypothetical protein
MVVVGASKPEQPQLQGKPAKPNQFGGKQRCFAVISVPQPHRIAPTYSRFNKTNTYIHKGSEKKHSLHDL